MNPRLNALFYFSSALTAYSQAQIELFFPFHLSLWSALLLPVVILYPPSLCSFSCVCAASHLLAHLPVFAIFFKVIWTPPPPPPAAPFHFVLFQSRRPILFSLANDFSTCCCLKLMKTIFHLHGVIWLGVAAQVCYGKINIMEGLTLLSWSGQDRCVCDWTGYITQTHGRACHVHALETRVCIVCKHTQGA